MPEYQTPGVYIEELPSGTKPIEGVETSTAVFVGSAKRGAVGEPVTIQSFAEFSNRFGGLWEDSMMSYAVRDFYQNGGSKAVILRLYHPSIDVEALDASTPDARLELGDLQLKAANPGVWGVNLRASVHYDAVDEDDPTCFNLTVHEDVEGGETEVFPHVSVDESDPRYLLSVLEQESLLARVVDGEMSTQRPPELDDIEATGGSDGDALTAASYLGSETDKTGLYALMDFEIFNLLCIPPAVRDGDTEPVVYRAAATLCLKNCAMLLVDSPAASAEPPETWGGGREAWQSSEGFKTAAVAGLDALGLEMESRSSAAFYFPRLLQADPLRGWDIGTFVPCGAVAGVIASTDSRRGVWKSPAGNDAALQGVHGLQVELTSPQNDFLNPHGINCLRTFPEYGHVVWGARTMSSDPEWRYIPVRRLMLYIEESVSRGIGWSVFEPNSENLWAKARHSVEGFLYELWRSGALQGAKPEEAYFVRCDRTTMTQSDIDQERLIVNIGFAPVRPAEFVIFRVAQQLAEP